MTILEIQKLEAARKLSGTPVSQWRKEHSIPRRQYYYWRSKVNRATPSSEGGFLPIEIYGKGNFTPQSTSEIEVELRTSTRTELGLRGSFSAEMIRALVTASVEAPYV